MTGQRNIEPTTNTKCLHVFLHFVSPYLLHDGA